MLDLDQMGDVLTQNREDSVTAEVKPKLSFL